MTHYSHDDLVLYFYGEGRGRHRIERHLGDCAACRAEYDTIASTLALVRPPVDPERDDRYGLEVWQRIRHQLPERERPFWPPWLAGSRAAIAAASAAVLLVAAFLVGRMSLGPTPAPAPLTADTGAAATAGERIRLDALGDHLERSERLLIDLANDPGGDIRDEQAWADDLISANRLYRDAALRAGDTTSATVLDDLERQLLDIVHAPSKLTRDQVDAMRTRLEAAALLLKVRVLHDELRGRQAPASPRKTT